MGAIIGKLIAGRLIKQILRKSFMDKIVPLFVDKLVEAIIKIFKKKK